MPIASSWPDIRQWHLGLPPADSARLRTAAAWSWGFAANRLIACPVKLHMKAAGARASHLPPDGVAFCSDLSSWPNGTSLQSRRAGAGVSAEQGRAYTRNACFVCRKDHASNRAL